MKENELKARFDEVSNDVGARRDIKTVRNNIAQISEIVTGMRDAGMDISLEVRAGDHLSAVPLDKSDKPLANGVIRISDVPVSFVIKANDYGSVILDLYAGREMISYIYLSETGDIRSLVSKTILEKKAMVDMLEPFNVGENARVGLSVDKSMPVSPPLKFRKPAP